MLTALEIVSRERGNIYLNLIICVEIVLAAVAQAHAFTYQDYLIEKEAMKNYFPVSHEITQQHRFLTNRSDLNHR
jgi:hypothetical protein